MGLKHGFFEFFKKSLVLKRSDNSFELDEFSWISIMIKIKERSIIVKCNFLTEDDVWNERRNVLNKLSIKFYNTASLFEFYH